MRQPTGCGEQNMVKFAPNIYVMKYLVAVDELTETLKDKLIKHMKSGIYTVLTVCETNGVGYIPAEGFVSA